MKTFHSAELLFAPPEPITWLVDGLIPAGAGGDTSGMPGDGKSTILLSMSAAISTGASFFGIKTAETPVAWISGEASGSAALARDLHRLKVGDSDITFLLPDNVMFRWIEDQWVTTAEGGAVIHTTHKNDDRQAPNQNSALRPDLRGFYSPLTVFNGF